MRLTTTFDNQLSVLRIIKGNLMDTAIKTLTFFKGDKLTREEWQGSPVMELLFALHKPISHRVRTKVFNFIIQNHVTDPNLYLAMPLPSDINHFTPETESFLLTILEHNPSTLVKAATVYSLLKGYFIVSQKMNLDKLMGKGLSTSDNVFVIDDDEEQEMMSANIAYWRRFSLAELEEKLHFYLTLAQQDYRKERLYIAVIDGMKSLGRQILGTLGRKAEILQYQIEHLSIGKMAPNESFETLHGDIVNLQKREGKVLLIDIWSSTCEPCKVKMPELMELQKKLSHKSFEIITLNVDRTREVLEDFIKSPVFFTEQIGADGRTVELAKHLKPYQKNPQFTLPVSYIGLGNSMKQTWGIDSYPTILLIDKSGVMRWRGNDIPNFLEDVVEEAS